MRTKIYCSLLVLVALCAVGRVQAAGIDESFLSHLTPEQRQKALTQFKNGFSNAESGASSESDIVAVGPTQERESDVADDICLDDEGYLRPEADILEAMGLPVEPELEARHTDRARADSNRYENLELSRLEQKQLAHCAALRRVAQKAALEGKQMESKLLPAPRAFGHDLFEKSSNTFAPATEIPVPRDFVIGPGDNLRVQLTGKESDSFTLLVSRDGTVNFPKLGPIAVAGLGFEEVQALIEERVANDLIGVGASVSMGKLRSIQIFVLGDARRPGSYTVSSLSTITHALYVSGGAKPTGSLRRIELRRSGRLVQSFDLYDLLLKGDSSGDVRLEPGDVVFIPPVGARITVEGAIKRPAIYELLKPLAVNKALELAGGLLASASLSTVQLERADPERGRVLEALTLDQDLNKLLRDGDVLRVREAAAAADNSVQIAGHLKYPGTYPWVQGMTLKSVLLSAEIKPSDRQEEAYLLMGAIERTDPVSGLRSFIAFDIQDTMKKTEAIVDLRPKDLVLIFSRSDIAFLGNRLVKDALLGVFNPRTCEGLKELRLISSTQRAVRYLRTLNSDTARSEKSERREEICPAAFTEFPRALTFLLDRALGMYGEVVRPGAYPVPEFSSVATVLRAAGGVTREADIQQIEYAPLESVAGNGKYQRLSLQNAEASQIQVVPGDVLNFKPKLFDADVGIVQILGEVNFPGSYTISRGETLSRLLDRAGGLTDSAYPKGAVFIRESAKKIEQESFQRAAADLQDAAVTAVTSGALGREGAANAQFLQSVVERLSELKPVGRIIIEADPSKLSSSPQLDIRLEPGDALTIPKQPRTVAVSGQVLNPGSVAYDETNTYRDYLDLAGGISQGADDDRLFVVFPNGAAQRLNTAWWSKGVDIPPGSQIVVPRDAAPINGMVLTERIIDIFSKLALSAASIAVISNQ